MISKYFFSNGRPTVSSFIGKMGWSVFLLILFFITATSISAQIVLPVNEEKLEDARRADAEWIPTGVWPFINRRFQVAEVVTGFVTKKKTMVPCNIHIGKQTLWFAQRDTLMEATAGSISLVKFNNGDTYIPISQNVFGKIVQDDEGVGKVVRVRLVDKKKMDEEAMSTSQMGFFSLSGEAIGTLDIDLMSSYVGNPEEQPLPIIDTFFFIYNLEIFEFTDKNVLARIDPSRKREYKSFTRSAEIISHNQSSALKVWNEFFVKRTPDSKKK